MASEQWVCPNCGAEIAVRAKSCRECGADEKAGWKQDHDYSHAFPELGEFDYAEFVSKEFGKEGVKPAGTRWWVWILALALLGSFALFLIRRII